MEVGYYEMYLCKKEDWRNRAMNDLGWSVGQHGGGYPERGFSWGGRLTGTEDGGTATQRTDTRWLIQAFPDLPCLDFFLLSALYFFHDYYLFLY